MEILDLKLINFRNFNELELKFPTRGALLYGENGVGKTNILEAIAFFAFGKSLRSNKDEDLINFSKAFFRLEANFQKDNIDYCLEANVEKNRKIIKINTNKVNRISDLYKNIKTIYFSPSDINIVAGSPGFRRNFLDIALSQYSFRYMEDLRRYLRIIKQRNALLKNRYNPREKSSWDEQFIDLSEKLISARLDYLTKIKPLLSEYFMLISDEQEDIELKYKYSFPMKDDIRTSMQKAIEVQQQNEREQQRTLLGPHLADIGFRINDHSARKFASQGQMRSLAIALRLVQSHMIAYKNDELPILMFDDVLADLDQTRAERILELLFSEHQIFIATPNIKLYRNYELKEIDVGKLG